MRQRRIAFANRKGGCGKTASAVNIAAGLALCNRKVLLIDCDAQAHATISLGFSPYNLDLSLYDLLAGNNIDIDDVLKKIQWPNGLFLIPATSQLSALELEGPIARSRLANNLSSSSINHFDYIIFDPPPTVGMLSIMSLMSAKEVMIPVQTHFLSMEALAEMVRFIYQMNATLNPELRISAIIPTFYNRTMQLSIEVVEDIKKNFGEALVLPPVRQNVALAEAPGFGQCIFHYAPSSIGAKDYKQLAKIIDSLSE